VHNLPEQISDKIPSGRLKKRPEFLLTAKNGQKWVSDTVIIQMVENDRSETRFGYTATKKIGNAVIRNRAKRRLRGAINDIIQFHDLKSCDVVLIARDVTATCEWDKLKKDILWCFKRLNIIKLP
jgi:ribonuclease P protein component